MNTYSVKIREILEKVITVKAWDKLEAEKKVEDIISRSEIVLDADDFSDREIVVEDEIGITKEVRCLDCGRKVLITQDDVKNDSLGPFTVCPFCKSSFDIDEEECKCIIN